MQTVLYVAFICFIIWLVFALLPIILPIVLIVIVVASIYIWRLKRKIVKHMDEYSDRMHVNFEEVSPYETYNNRTTNQGDIIDVEFSEREDIGE